MREKSFEGVSLRQNFPHHGVREAVPLIGHLMLPRDPNGKFCTTYGRYRVDNQYVELGARKKKKRKTRRQVEPGHCGGHW